MCARSAVAFAVLCAVISFSEASTNASDLHADTASSACSQGVALMRHVPIEGFSPGDSRYNWKKRFGYKYYDTARFLAYQYAPDARTLLDVGSNSIPFPATFTWVPQKAMLNPFFPEGFSPPKGVDVIKADFYEYNCSTPADLVMCNQVLEHVEDPAAFMQKLLQCGKTVVISVPYLWPMNSAIGKHLTDMIDLPMIERWAGILPKATAVVREDMTQTGRRIIVVFNKDQEEPSHIIYERQRRWVR